MPASYAPPPNLNRRTVIWVTEVNMATPAPEFRTSLVPIFMARLRTLQAIASGLNELPQPLRADLELLLKQAEKLIQDSLAPIPPETDLEGNGNP
jgi:hypothetical protein